MTKLGAVAVPLFATLLAALPANAQVARSSAALMINEGDCGLVDADLNQVVSDDVKVVRTQSRDGVMTYRCQADGVANNTGGAVVLNLAITDLLCGAIDPIGVLRITDDWQLTISASGRATLQCQFRL